MTAEHLPSGQGRGPLGPSTLAVHAGEHRQKAGDAITDPIFCAVDLHLPRHAGGHRLHRAEAAARGVRPLRQPRREGRRAQAGRAGRGRRWPCSSPAAWRPSSACLMAKLNAGDEVVFFDECYHRSREFCAKHLSRFGVTTRQVKACDYEAMEAAITPRTQAAGQRVAHQPAPERRRSGPLRRHRPPARRRDADRRHAGHALQPAAARGRRRLRAALGHQVSRRAQRPAGRRHHRLDGEAGAGPQAPRHHGGDQLAAQHLPAAARAEDVRAADAAAQRRTAWPWPSSWPSIRASRRSIIRACRSHPVPRRRPAARCAASAGW